MSVTQVRKQQVIDRLTSGLESLLKGRKVTVVPGTGTLAPDGRTVRVSDGTELRGRNVVIATGSLPRSLPVAGFEFDEDRVLSSDHVLELGEVPGRIAVVGGGAIGCEFASFFVGRRCRGHAARGAPADPRRRRPAGRANGGACVREAEDQGRGRGPGVRARAPRFRTGA